MDGLGFGATAQHAEGSAQMRHRLFDRIVVPLDGSETAEQALPYGEVLASGYGVCLHLVRVIDAATLPQLAQNDEPERLIRELLAAERMSAEYLSHVSTKLQIRGLAVTTEVRRGHPGRQLLAALGADDLIVIAAGGRGGRRESLGSVSADVVGHAPAPVLVIPNREAWGHRPSED